MTGFQIVREEAAHLAKGMMPLAVVAGAVLALCGQASWRMVISLAFGTCYAWVLFVLMGRNVARSVTLPPGQAEACMRKGYALRYALTGVVILVVLKLPFFHPLAAILPLFFPKLVLLFGSAFQRKGGKTSG